MAARRACSRRSGVDRRATNRLPGPVLRQIDPVDTLPASLIETCNAPTVGGPEHRRHASRQTKRSPRSIRLRLGELIGPDSEGVSNGQRAGVEVDVLPAQPERLALPKPEGDREDVQRLLASAFDRIGPCPRPSTVRPSRLTSRCMTIRTRCQPGRRRTIGSRPRRRTPMPRPSGSGSVVVVPPSEKDVRLLQGTRRTSKSPSDATGSASGTSVFGWTAST